MLQLFSWGEIFISTLSSVGDWLLSKPFHDATFVRLAKWANFFSPNELNEFVAWIGNQSVASLLLSSSLLAILTIKVVKLFK